MLVSRVTVPAETFTVQLHGFPPQSTSKLGFGAIFPACAEGASPSASIIASAPIPDNAHGGRRLLIGITWIFIRRLLPSLDRGGGRTVDATSRVSAPCVPTHRRAGDRCGGGYTSQAVISRNG